MSEIDDGFVLNFDFEELNKYKSIVFNIDGVYDSSVLNIFDEVTDEARKAISNKDGILLIAVKNCERLELFSERTKGLLEEDGKVICICDNDKLRDIIKRSIKSEPFHISLESYLPMEEWIDKISKLKLPNDHRKVCTKRYKQNNNLFNNKEYYRRERISKLIEKEKETKSEK